MEGALALHSDTQVVAPDFEEAACVRRFKDGDRAAFESLLQRYQGIVLAYGLRTLKDEGLARDLAQEVFLTLWRGRDAYEHQGKLRAYLLTVARHRALAQLKRRRSVHRLKTAVQAVPSAPGPTPLQDAQRLQAKDRLQAALHVLPPDRAEVIRLRFILELPVAEIAEITGVPVGTVKSRIGRGLAGLRKELGHEQ